MVGPNGAGKTTLLNHITGALKAECGVIEINGEPVFENDKIKKNVLSISDDWFYYSTYTIKQMAKFYADIYPDFSVSRYEAIKQVFKIDEKRQIRKLSKGMKKQVAFWLSLSAMPDVPSTNQSAPLISKIKPRTTRTYIIKTKKPPFFRNEGKKNTRPPLQIFVTKSCRLIHYPAFWA